jgi:D-alanine transaminase
MQLAMVQDRIIPLEDVHEAYFDRGMFFGDGVYEVIRSYNGKIFALDDHLQRFGNSLAAVGIDSIDVASIREHVCHAFEQSGIANAKIYFHVTRGTAPRDLLESDDLEANFFMTITELEDKSSEKLGGIAVSTHPDWRWQRCAIKSLNLLGNVLARRDAAKKGCQEAIFVDDAGLITEGAASSFFALFVSPEGEGQEPNPVVRLQTSSLAKNILPSVTRIYVIRAAQALGLAVVEESFTCQQVPEANELFVASTTRDIVPVVVFNGQAIGDGRPGEWTLKLLQEFASFV